MSKISSGLGSNAGAMVAGGAMVVVLALGAYIAFGNSVPKPEMTTASLPEAAAPPAEQPDVATVETADKVDAKTVPAPTFDELRREGDGTTIIAGRAEPMSDVKILVDGEEVASAKADSSGGFAAIAMLPPAASAQVVSLSSVNAGAKTASVDEIILAPSSNPSPSVAEPAAPSQPDLTVAPPVLDTAAAPAPPEEQPEAAASVADPAPAPEPARVAVLKSDAEGVSLLNPQAMTSVALDTIGYSELGDVQLTGRAQPATKSVRIYLDNRSVINLPVGADGRWRGDLPDVDEGVYTLRVDEVSADGAVSSRVETPFKRESAETLAQAAASGAGPVKSVTVQTGATLWAIARARYGDGTMYVRVFEANAGSIRDPDLIYPGQVFDLPN